MSEMGNYSANKIARYGRRLGLKLFSANPVLGLKRILEPIEYVRYVEFQYVLDNLKFDKNSVLLDIGSPKMIGLFLGSKVGKCFLTDVSEYFIDNINEEISALSSNDKYVVETQNACSLKYPDDEFDGIFSVSVIEHIDGNGDSEAMRELARVLRPGGRICITVPHNDGGYREVFKRKDDPYAYWVKESNDEKIFYQRIYDRYILEERLIKPSNLKLVDLSYFGETKWAAENFSASICRFNVVSRDIILNSAIDCCFQPSSSLR